VAIAVASLLGRYFGVGDLFLKVGEFTLQTNFLPVFVFGAREVGPYRTLTIETYVS